MGLEYALIKGLEYCVLQPSMQDSSKSNINLFNRKCHWTVDINGRKMVVKRRIGEVVRPLSNARLVDGVGLPNIV